jgi:hypothetical protein
MKSSYYERQYFMCKSLYIDEAKLQMRVAKILTETYRGKKEIKAWDIMVRAESDV